MTYLFDAASDRLIGLLWLAGMVTMMAAWYAIVRWRERSVDDASHMPTR